MTNKFQFVFVGACAFGFGSLALVSDLLRPADTQMFNLFSYPFTGFTAALLVMVQKENSISTVTTTAPVVPPTDPPTNVIKTIVTATSDPLNTEPKAPPPIKRGSPDTWPG